MFIYTVDTSSFINLERYYSKDEFPDIWKKFNSLVDSKHIISPEQVYEEIGRSQKVLSPWCDNHKFMFQKVDPTYLIKSNIIKEYSNIVSIHTPGKDYADRYVIALAHMRINNPSNFESIIITEEKKTKHDSSPNKPINLDKIRLTSKKIPDIAERYDIRCMNLCDFFHNEGWKV